MIIDSGLLLSSNYIFQLDILITGLLASLPFPNSDCRASPWTLPSYDDLYGKNIQSRCKKTFYYFTSSYKAYLHNDTCYFLTALSVYGESPDDNELAPRRGSFFLDSLHWHGSLNCFNGHYLKAEVRSEALKVQAMYIDHLKTIHGTWW